MIGQQFYKKRVYYQLYLSAVLLRVLENLSSFSSSKQPIFREPVGDCFLKTLDQTEVLMLGFFGNNNQQLNGLQLTTP